MSVGPKKVNCPRCGKPAIYSAENKHRPFCSERCQLIDLGEWASNKYSIPEKLTETGNTDNLESQINDNESPTPVDDVNNTED